MRLYQLEKRVDRLPTNRVTHRKKDRAARSPFENNSADSHRDTRIPVVRYVVQPDCSRECDPLHDDSINIEHADRLRILESSPRYVRNLSISYDTSR